MPLTNTLPTGSKPSTPGLAPFHITRATLRNGYRAYYPEDFSSPNKAAAPLKQKKTVRFVKGHTTIPNIPFSHLAAPAPTNHRHHHTPTPIITTHYTTHDSPDLDSDPAEYLPEEEEDATPPLTPALARKHLRGKVERLPREDGTAAAAVPWRKTPRFRGSGFVQVLDNPVAEGLALAGEKGLGLPSDSWRDVVRAGRGVVVVREGEGEMGMGMIEGAWMGVRSESGRERGLGMRDGDVGGLGAWRGGEGGYVVRVVAAGGRKARWGKVKIQGAGEAKEEGVEVDDESGTLTEGSDSEDGDEYDFVHDFSLEEAEGWVPVMVAEEDQGDDWMSLTGSWIKMGDAPGDVKRREEKVVVG